MVNFGGSLAVNKMEKKDIIIVVALLLLSGVSLYRRYMKKKVSDGNVSAKKPAGKSSPSVQPDDYEPYSGDNKPE